MRAKRGEIVLSAGDNTILKSFPKLKQLFSEKSTSSLK